MNYKAGNFSVIPILIAGVIVLAALFLFPHLIQIFYGQKAPSVNPGLSPNNGMLSPGLLPNNGIVSPGPAGPGLYVSQSTAYKDSTGVIHIVGEIQNVFSYPVSSVKVTASVSDSNNLIVATPSSYTDIDQLRPGEKSGFQIVLGIPLTGGKNYQLSTSYVQAPTPKPQVLNLILGQPYTDNTGQYHVVGEIINQGQLGSKRC